MSTLALFLMGLMLEATDIGKLHDQAGPTEDFLRHWRAANYHWSSQVWVAKWPRGLMFTRRS